MKVGVVGAGMVGSASAYAMVLRGSCSELVLVDANPRRAEAEAQDISHAVPFAYSVRVSAGDYGALKGAAVVVLCCGVSQRPGESRLELLARNAEVYKDVIAKTLASAPDAILVVATNPVDVMTQVAAQLSGLGAERVIGTGTLLDTARFKSLLGAHLDLSPKSIHAYVLGEHGDSEVLCWSAASAGNIPLEEVCSQLGTSAGSRVLDSEVRESIEEGVRGAAYRIIEGKGATWYGIGAGVARLVAAIGGNEHTVLTVSTADSVVDSQGAIALSLPRVLGRQGVQATLFPKLNDEERMLLSQSATVLRKAWDQVRTAL